MNEVPVTRDNQPFKLGQTLFTRTGQVFPTSPETHEMNVVKFEGNKVITITRKGSKIEYDISNFFSSEEARLKEIDVVPDKELIFYY